MSRPGLESCSAGRDPAGRRETVNKADRPHGSREHRQDALTTCKHCKISLLYMQLTIYLVRT